MRLNISQAKAYRDNPVRWYYTYVLRRKPKAAASAALTVGTAFHTFMEFYPEGMTPAELQVSIERERLIKANQADAALKLEAEWAQMAQILPHWKDRFEFQTLAVEQELEAPLPSGKHTLYGRPDRIAVYGSRLWHIQNRSLAATKNIATYLKAAVLDPHELGYAWLIQRAFTPESEYLARCDYGGTLFNIVRKLTLVGKTGRALHAPDECFVQEFLPIRAGLVVEFIKGLERIADEMEHIISEGIRPLVCSDHCRLGPYGNSLCPYFQVCAMQADIHDNSLFEDAVDPYEAREAASVSEE